MCAEAVEAAGQRAHFLSGPERPADARRVQADAGGAERARRQPAGDDHRRPRGGVRAVQERLLRLQRLALVHRFEAVGQAVARRPSAMC